MGSRPVQAVPSPPQGVETQAKCPISEDFTTTTAQLGQEMPLDGP